MSFPAPGPFHTIVRRVVSLAIVTTVLIVPAAGALNAGQERTDLPVMGADWPSFDAFYAHATTKNPGLDRYYARRLYDTYRAECETEGVSLLVALSQMVHETDYLLFTGSVAAVQYNYAGLGATGPGVAGLGFYNMRTGVRAHVQHLKAYGSTDPLVHELADPRFYLVRRGSAETVMELTGRWAADPDYGIKVLVHANRMIARDRSSGSGGDPPRERH